MQDGRCFHEGSWSGGDAVHGAGRGSLLCLLPPPASAQKVIHVWKDNPNPEDAPYASWSTASKGNDALEDALDEAEKGDIVVVRAGVYHERVTLPEGVTLVSEAVLVLGGDVDGTEGQVGRAVAAQFRPDRLPELRDRWARVGPTFPIIDGGQGGTVITVAAGARDARTRVVGFAIRNGKESPTGGGIAAVEATVQIIANDISTNFASDRGGGIHILHPRQPLVIDNNCIRSNTSAGGAGITIEDQHPFDVEVQITRNLISNNMITGPAFHPDVSGIPGLGAGIWIRSARARIESNEITQNSIERNLTLPGGDQLAALLISGGLCGGGIGVSSAFQTGEAPEKIPGGVQVRGNDILENVARLDGGGVRIWREYSAQLVNNRILNNEALDDGGGVSASSILQLNFGTPILDLDRNNVSGNTAHQSGGGVHLTASAFASVRESHVSANKSLASEGAANGGGGVFVRSGQIRLFDSRIIGNSSNRNGGGMLVVRIEETIDLTPDAVTLEMSGCDIAENACTREGGGMAILRILPQQGSGKGITYRVRRTNVFANLSTSSESTVASGFTIRAAGGIFIRNGDLPLLGSGSILSECRITASNPVGLKIVSEQDLGKTFDFDSNVIQFQATGAIFSKVSPEVLVSNFFDNGFADVKGGGLILLGSKSSYRGCRFSANEPFHVGVGSGGGVRFEVQSDFDGKGVTKVGIQVSSDGIVSAITRNDFDAHVEFALRNESATTVSALDNWWGERRGPQHATNTFNPGGVGERVSDNVEFGFKADKPLGAQGWSLEERVR
jgi:hypothetical protein